MPAGFEAVIPNQHLDVAVAIRGGFHRAVAGSDGDGKVREFDGKELPKSAFFVSFFVSFFGRILQEDTAEYAHALCISVPGETDDFRFPTSVFGTLGGQRVDPSLGLADDICHGHAFQDTG